MGERGQPEPAQAAPEHGPDYDFFARRVKGVDGTGLLGVHGDALERFVEGSQYIDSRKRRISRLDQGVQLQGMITGLEKASAPKQRREAAGTFGFYLDGPNLNEECELLLERLIELADQDGRFQFVATIPSEAQAMRTDAALQALEDRGFLLAVDFDEAEGRRGRLSEKGRSYFDNKAAHQEARRQELRDQRKHEWALTHVTGMYGIVGVLLGIVIGYLLGRL